MNKTKAMRWNDSLEIGVEIIDNQHKMLFDLANDLNNSVKIGANKQVIDTLFSVIISYAFTHFETEEVYFTDQNEFLRHCYKHYQLVRQLHQYSIDFRNNRKLEVEPGEFMENWLLEHIKECDIPALTSSEVDLVLEGEIDNLDNFDTTKIDKRHHKRVRYDRVLDEDIVGHCYNANKMKSGNVTVVDLAGGGFKVYSEQKHDVEDLLIISCRVGKNFKMREKMKVKNSNNNFYGLEFVAPDEETVRFLTELCGAVHKYY